MTNALVAAVQTVIDAECGFRERNPECGRVLVTAVHYGDAVGCDAGEVAYVEFERVGMNLIERGKQTVTWDGERAKRGRVRDFTATYHDGVPMIPAGKSFPSFADACRLTPETAPR